MEENEVQVEVYKKNVFDHLGDGVRAIAEATPEPVKAGARLLGKAALVAGGFALGCLVGAAASGSGDDNEMDEDTFEGETQTDDSSADEYETYDE